MKINKYGNFLKFTFLRKKYFCSSFNSFPNLKIKGVKLDDKLNKISKSIKVSNQCINVFILLIYREKIKEIIDKKPDNKFLRLMVEGGGCSGFQYIFKMDNLENESEDIIFENGSTKIVIDKLSLPYLEGSIIDFKESMIKSSFTVLENPKAEISCSCGSSFSPKMNDKI